jgi:hypothetical protein
MDGKLSRKGGNRLKKAIIFGASGFGRVIYNLVKDTDNVLFFVDNNPDNCYPPPIGTIHNADIIKQTQFDVIYVASLAGANSIYRQLKEDLLVSESKISLKYATPETLNDYIFTPRIRFLEQFANYAHARGIHGSVAEVGVLRGDFAKEINRVFPKEKCFLFDTFEGFDNRDFSCEANQNERYSQIEEMRKTFNTSETSVDIVMEKMPHPDKCVVKKGFFPDTFDIANEMFSFVNLDTDLYQPTVAGLEIFYPLMVKGGVILIHDYFGGATLGVRKAVDEFLESRGTEALPIGDYSSVTIVKV